MTFYSGSHGNHFTLNLAITPEHITYEGQQIKVGLWVCNSCIVPPWVFSKHTRSGLTRRLWTFESLDFESNCPHKTCGGRKKKGKNGSGHSSLDLCMCDWLSPRREGGSILMASYRRLCPGQWTIRSKCWSLGRAGFQWTCLNFHNNFSLLRLHVLKMDVNLQWWYKPFCEAHNYIRWHLNKLSKQVSLLTPEKN